MSVSGYLLQEKLWKPMGMEADGSWSLDSTQSGFEKMESGLNARARDFGRFGMLFAKEGRWEGEQLISQGWIEQSTRADTSTDPSQGYQYFWWVDTPDATNHFSARGNYGQYIYVAPDLQNILDLLRNEKPMYLLSSGSGGGFENGIKTTPEPVGEEEAV